MQASYWDEVAAPWGSIVIGVDEENRLCSIDLHGRAGSGRRDPARCRNARRELLEYFAGRRRSFTVPLALDGTPFQRAVWRALREIPFGSVASYGDVAARIGQPRAARAVGQANGANPVPIIVPCHRVIAGDGGLGGFGGGLAVKRSLLALEGMELAA